MSVYKKYSEIINYIMVGAFTTFVSLGSYYLCVLTIFNPKNAFLLQIANIISWLLSVIFAFWANKKFVFKSKSKKIMNEVTKFYGSRLFTLLLDMAIMFVTVTLFHLNDKFMKIFSNIIILVLNYLISKFLVFVKREN